jgi:hypothetical protein
MTSLSNWRSSRSNLSKNFQSYANNRKKNCVILCAYPQQTVEFIIDYDDPSSNLVLAWLSASKILLAKKRFSGSRLIVLSG